MKEQPLSAEEMRVFLDAWVYLKQHPIVAARLSEDPDWEPNSLWQAMQEAATMDEYFQLDRRRCRIIIAEWQEFQAHPAGKPG